MTTQKKFLFLPVISAIEVKYPKFVGTGYLALPVLRDAHKEFRVSLDFKPESQNGLLLFSAEFSNAKTDFFSVVLEDGFVVYRSVTEIVIQTI